MANESELTQSEGQFSSPGQDPGQPEETSGESFADPSEDALGVQAADQELESYAAELGGDLMALKGEIESKLASTAQVEAAVQTLEEGNIVGVGVTDIDAESLAAGLAEGALPGQAGLAVFTVERVDRSQLQAQIASVAGTRSLSEMPMVQVPVGVVDAQSHRMRLRPAPGGISVGHVSITAGTLGCLCVGNRAPRSSRLMILSNNHVLANSNAARIGDCIVQPGPADGGRCPADQIAILERFVRINFSGGINYVDCATGWAWPDRVRRELMYLSGGRPVYFRVGSSPIAPAINMVVGKTGRTTQLRQGRVTAIGVSVNVNYGGGKVAHFRDQIAIRGLSGDFSAGGDSGSLIWQWATGLRPVGLLFAGGGGTTFGNRITRVLSGLDIRLYV
jgi:hypothetical protein